MDPPIPANELQYEAVAYEVPYAFTVGGGWQDLVQPGGGEGGDAAPRGWAYVA